MQVLENVEDLIVKDIFKGYRLYMLNNAIEQLLESNEGEEINEINEINVEAAADLASDCYANYINPR